MATLQPFSLIFSSALLILLLLPLLSAHATNSPNSDDKIASPFDFLKGLQGCQKAVKTYQLNYHLNATGTLDDKTVSTMMMPRCEVPDIINGSNWMHLGKKWHQEGHGSFHTVSHYSFFQKRHKWPPSKYHLTYGFVESTSTKARNAVVQALRTWSSRTHFTFGPEPWSGSNPDILVGFYRWDHGDGNSFDGAGGILAHAFAPQDGRFHYDSDDRWSVGAVKGAFDMQTIALHEIGHNLGLEHSSIREAVMYPYFPPGTTKLRLHPDDIKGTRVLYNMSNGDLRLVQF
ncbi:hypothetical protein FH972_014730 [Carpinus fangiana]|uniref:Peptidase metallopeptidase domain-containing protein n=1 Tax=Carpinus fangiana TaxID=176857 RepID=A0A5N6RDU5_9ROSI|nr:hypothetical protein FH972_014730 [Carpinus fangiana]